MLLQNGTERIPYFVDLGNGELHFLPSVRLQAERASGKLFS